MYARVEKLKENNIRKVANNERNVGQKMGFQDDREKSKPIVTSLINPETDIVQRKIITIEGSKSEHHVKKLVAADPNIRRLDNAKKYKTTVKNKNLTEEQAVGLTEYKSSTETIVYIDNKAHKSKAATRATLSHELMLHVLPHFRKNTKDDTLAQTDDRQHKALILGSDFGTYRTKTLRSEWSEHVKKVTAQYVKLSLIHI